MTIRKIIPNWPAPSNVVAFTTCRQGGVSRGDFDSLNFGLSTGDDEANVIENRRRLRAHLPSDPYWLQQVHGTDVVAVNSQEHPKADASYTHEANQVCLIQTADCLPILICDTAGQQVAAIHAGWRSLAAGIISNTLECLQTPSECMAWLGPAISQQAFEVGPEVREQFIAANATFAKAFVTGEGDRWHADLCAIAKECLQQAGVAQVYQSDCCTHQDAESFFSYRRDQRTGRMVSVIYFT